MKTPLLALLSLFCGAAALQAEKVIHTIDFTTQPAGDAVPWLKANGFEFKLDFESLNPRFENGALRMSTGIPMAGLVGTTFLDGKELHGVKRIRVVWGVSKHPNGANWEKGMNRLAIGLLVSFGNVRLSSGLPFGIQAAPYFIGPFLGDKEVEGKVYTGKLWREGGRYVCVKAPTKNEEVTTELEVHDFFQKLFSKTATPPVTALGIQMNSKGTAGEAEAFVKKVEFLGDDVP